MHYNLKEMIFSLERSKVVLLFFLSSILLVATTNNQFTLSRYDDIFFSPNMHQLYNVNVNYKYEEKDINSLLQLRAKEEGLDLNVNILMLSLGDTSRQLEYQLRKEYLHSFESKKKTTPYARNILIPLNLTKIHHWVGIIIRLNKFNQVQQINYIDPLHSNIPANVKEFLQNVYGEGIKIKNTQELL